MIPVAAEASLGACLRALRGAPMGIVLDLGPRGTLVSWGQPLARDGRWQDAMRAGLRPTRRSPWAGVVGYLGYEAGAEVERMPAARSPRRLPDWRFWRVEGALLHSPTGRWGVAGDTRFQREAARVLADAQAEPAPQPPRPEGTRPGGQWDPIARTSAAQVYQEAVAALLDDIRRGDVYQANLAWERIGPPLADPLADWLQLRARNPARRGAYLWTPEFTVLSNSPELFLAAANAADGTRLVSAPIKGTCAASAGRAGRAALRDSPKEQAELTMIVDLVRNDLGRVARTGTVVAGPRRLRRCGDLIHAESVVRATLDRGLDTVDALAACFPPGSVTGAPKVAAMERINALEGAARGVYTGAIGALWDDGSCHFNVAIRTVTCDARGASFHVGAGIVAESDPALEWAETMAKGRALSAALGWQP